MQLYIQAEMKVNGNQSSREHSSHQSTAYNVPRHCLRRQFLDLVKLEAMMSGKWQ